MFPVVAVAEKLRELESEVELLFVGTKDKIEARVVPQLGIKFKSIWISGFQRSLTIRNFLFPLKLLVSMLQSLMISFRFKPNVAIGSGAYVTGPVLWGASVMGAKIMLLEQNSYPGITNRLLEKKADQIHISFEDSKKYFREQSKLRLTGNPVRLNIVKRKREDASKEFGLDPEKKTLLILGGSLGARSINKAVSEILDELVRNDLQVLWQTGKNEYEEYKNLSKVNVIVKPFIDSMSAAYSCADIIVARAGATTIAETAVLGLPVIFIPSPNVAEDHQFKNAKSLEDNDGCVLIKDSEIGERLFPSVMELISNDVKRELLSDNIKKFSVPDAAEKIAKSALALSGLN